MLSGGGGFAESLSQIKAPAIRFILPKIRFIKSNCLLSGTFADL